MQEIRGRIKTAGSIIDQSFQTIEEKKAEIRALKVRREYLRETLIRIADGREK
jgi:hypothetical protein